MRVTHGLLSDSLITLLGRDLERLLRMQERIATGRNYRAASENPIATAQIVRYTGKMAKSAQYRRTVDTGVIWNEMTSSTLAHVKELLMAILGVSERVSDSSTTSAERAQAAVGVNSLLEELVMAANRKFNDKYLFGGTETLTVPFTANYDGANAFVTGVTQNPDGIGGVWSYPVSEVDTVTINMPGDEVFQPNGEAATDDVFQIAVRLRQALQSQDFDAMALEEGRLREAILRVTSVDSRVGNRINHLESIGEAVDAEALAYNEQRSKLEDTDVAKAIIEFNMADNIYQAALASTARILGLSLVNFL